tara:strand:+ start:729 stop:1019 length:291 start_codon:yes stop_codon:yes gene_type:complete
MKHLIILFYFLLFGIMTSCSQESSWENKEKEAAMKDCLNSGHESEFCACSVEVLTSLITYQEFYDFDQHIKAGKQPPSEIASKMMEMSKKVYSNCK